MRIFSSVRHSLDPQKFYGGLWSGNFYPALRQLGHAIIESQTDLLPTSQFMHIASRFTPEEMAMRTQTTEKILDEVHAAHREGPIDLFLSYFYNAHFDPAGFDELRTLGIPSVNFYCNSIYQFPFVASVAKKADFSWHPEKDARELYLRAGARPVRVQMAADPEIYRPLPHIRRRLSACFIGQRYADRVHWLAALNGANLAVDVYGAGWKTFALSADESSSAPEKFYLGRKQHQPGSLMSYVHTIQENIQQSGFVGGLLRTAKQWRYRRETQRLTPQIFAHAKGKAADIAITLAAYEICLNFSNVWSDGRPGSTLIPHVRLRDFEGPMCRTCYLTGHTEEIEELYEVGKEIDTYRTPEELIEKTRFYLDHPEEAEKLRFAGHERARRDHTWVQRFEELFAKIGLRPAKSSAVSLAT